MASAGMPYGLQAMLKVRETRARSRQRPPRWRCDGVMIKTRASRDARAGRARATSKRSRSMF